MAHYHQLTLLQKSPIAEGSDNSNEDGDSEVAESNSGDELDSFMVLHEEYHEVLREVKARGHWNISFRK